MPNDNNDTGTAPVRTKEHETELREQWKQIADEFDFEKVAYYMKMTNWSVCFRDTPPDEADVRRTANELFESLISNVSLINARTMGLRVELDRNRVSLMFVPVLADRTREAEGVWL